MFKATLRKIDHGWSGQQSMVLSHQSFPSGSSVTMTVARRSLRHRSNRAHGSYRNYIPRALVITPCDDAIAVAEGVEDASWATALTAAALIALHEPKADLGGAAKKDWISEWTHGGWATLNSDLGAPGVQWGADYVTGNLMATGSDNDKNIYAKFQFPCHPVVHRAGIGLSQLTMSEKTDALEALQRRGRAFRSMRDALIPLVQTPTLRPKGSQGRSVRGTWRICSRVSFLARRWSSSKTVRRQLLRLSHCTSGLHTVATRAARISKLWGATREIKATGRRSCLCQLVRIERWRRAHARLQLCSQIA